MSTRRHGRGRRRPEEEHEEHANHERWLVTYADMLTLLMVLFIVMFSMSQVDQKKYTALKNGLADGFGVTSSFMKGSNSILDGNLAQASHPELDGTQIFEQLSPEEQQTVTAVMEAQRRTEMESSLNEAAIEAERLKDAEQELTEALRTRGLADDVSTTIDSRGLVVSLVSRYVVFQPNIAQLSPRGEKVVDALAPVLKRLGNDLRIDGHTNQAAGPPKYYATDWDLSAARALSVLRRLDEQAGIPSKRLSMAAFGHEKPLLDPSTARSQEINKRVDIVVLPNIGQSAEEVFGEVASGVRIQGRGAGTDGSTDRADESVRADNGSATNPSTGSTSSTEGSHG